MNQIVVNGSTRGGIVIDPSGSSRIGSVVIKEGSGDRYPPYEGKYRVEAQLDKDEVLNTKGRIMTDNLTFVGMHVRIVTNPSGGLTYYIGE